MEQATNLYRVTFDGQTVAETESANAALIHLHHCQSNSWAWAFTVGWDIITPDGLSVARGQA